MSNAILTRWPVALELTVGPGEVEAGRRPAREALLAWFRSAREAYFEDCVALRRALDAEHLALDVSGVRLRPAGEVHVGETVLVAVSTIELRPSSVEMAFRVRRLGGDAELVAEGRCTVALLGPDGSAVRIPEAVHAELIELERSAARYC